MESDTSDSEDIDYVPSNTADADLSETSDDELVCSDEDSEKNKCKHSRKRKVNQKSSEEEKSFKKTLITADSSISGKNNAEKLKAEEVYKNFLEEVDNETNQNINPHAHISLSDVSRSENSQIGKEEIIEIGEKDKCSKIFEFAGEILAIEDGVITSSSSSVMQMTANPKPFDSIKGNIKRKGGLDSVLGILLSKKKKMNTLEKTQIDWTSYKKDEGLENEIKHFNKGKGGFLERQRFLERSDLRSFEIEKAARLSKMKKP